MTDRLASFTRIHSGDQTIRVAHMDGQVSIFASGAAYAIFVSGLRHTNYTLYDEVVERWVVGTVDQLVE